MKRVKCGNFWIHAEPFQSRGDVFAFKYEWRFELFTAKKSDRAVIRGSSGSLFRTSEDAQKDIDKFIAAANRDTSLPLNGTVS